MTAFLISQRRRSLPRQAPRVAVLPLLSAVIALGGLACAGTRAPIPEGALLEPLAPLPAHLPDRVDYAAIELATASLVGSHEDAADALLRFEGELDSDPYRRPEQRDGKQLLAERRAGESLRPFAIDVANAALPRASEYREGAKALLRRADLNPAHRTRLEEDAADDPLALAQARIQDHRESLWAQTFNAASRPIGRSLISGLALAPYSLAQAITHYFAALNERPAISIQERQALAHWQRYLAMEPDAPDAERVRAKIEAAQAKLDRHFADQFGSAAAASLEAEQPRLALSFAERALAHRADDRRAARTAERARLLLERERAGRARSLEAPQSLAVASSAERALAIASLVDRSEPAANAGIDPADAGRADPGVPAAASHASGSMDSGRSSTRRPGAALAAQARRAQHSPDPALRDLGEFSLATVQAERGHPTASFARLDVLARKDPGRSTVARHAAALVVDPFQNPYAHWRRETSRAATRTAAFRLFGAWSSGPRYRSLPAGVAYLLDAPAVAQAVITAPLRVLLQNWEPQPDFRRPAALAAYRTLARYPSGEHRRDLLDWLYQYESERKHLSSALRIADQIPDFDPEQRRELAEAVADERLLSAAGVERADLRATLLRTVVQEFPETQAGRDAGTAAREEAIDRSPQRIRLTRGFLRENASVAGRSGLGLRADLLDGNLANGELHPDGVILRGGREIEIALLDESGDEDEKPVMRKLRISQERLARSVAQLEEAAIVGAQIDRDDDVAPDARRDRYFERARLGLTEQPDGRAAARSTYVYRGLRERFGLVRGRESVLPFDLVLQGSLVDLSLGAYPRWREPELTNDAFLYR